MKNHSQSTSNSQHDFVILPLYSPTEKAFGHEPVPSHSHCNQWNAGGTDRKNGELYISVPTKLNELHPDFFPPRDEVFTLAIPTGDHYSAKICQDADKSLMTSPNNELEAWLLRGQLKLVEGELLTYDKLTALGFDSVKVTKVGDHSYTLEIAGLGSYEEFING